MLHGGEGDGGVGHGDVLQAKDGLAIDVEHLCEIGDLATIDTPTLRTRYAACECALVAAVGVAPLVLLDKVLQAAAVEAQLGQVVERLPASVE